MVLNFKKLLLPILIFCAAPAAGQQLYISKADVWTKGDGNGYCNDIPTLILVPVTGNFAGNLTGASAGGVYTHTDGDGVWDSSSTESVSYSTPYAVTLAGNLTWFDGYASGLVSGLLTAPAPSGTSSQGTISCSPAVSFTEEVYVTGTGPAGGILTAPVNHGVSWNLVCVDAVVPMTAFTTGTVSGVMSGWIPGLINGVTPENVWATFSYSGYVSGTLTGNEPNLSGNVAGNLPATTPTGTSSVGPITCNTCGNYTGGIPASGTSPLGASVTLPASVGLICSNFTCWASNGVDTWNSTMPNSLSGTIAGTVFGAVTGSKWLDSPSSTTIAGSIVGTVSGTVPVTPDVSVSFITSGGNVWKDSSLIEFERPRPPLYPGACLGLCATVVCVSTTGTFGIDDLTFEIFKFGAGANPLDPASTPPIKTTSMYNVGKCESTNNETYRVGSYCTAWDGSYNLNGLFGKTNGQFGFRARVKTNQVSMTAGNIVIEQTSAFPGQNQIPIQVNVTNIHAVRSSPTVVGKITGVAAQPYNILYRLSKDALVNINIYDASAPLVLPLVRNILVNAPRTGEGTPDGTLTNGDFWDGRDNTGNFVAGGNYIARIEASSNDMWQPPTDLAFPATIQMSLDPLQVTDVAIRPLGASSTDMATISYMLTESATVYVTIYPPNTQINYLTGAATPNNPIRSFIEVKDRRQTVSTYWDGRDNSGSPVCDGDYVYTIDAVMPSNSAFAPAGEVWTVLTKVGTIPVARGKALAFINPSSTVIGSTQQVAGLDPFYFRYTPLRDTFVSLYIKKMDGRTVVSTVTENVMRYANFSNREIWNGKDNNGLFVSSGAYLAELVTTDPFQCSTQKTSTTTAVIPVNMFRTVDVLSSPLMGGTSDLARVSFELSQPMYMKLRVYPVDSVINPSDWPNVTGTPVYTVEGMRPGRFKITEYWDGRNVNGRLEEDGRYPFTLVAYTTGTAQVMQSVDKVYGYVDISRGKIIFTMFDVIPNIPTMYNSSDTVKLPPYEIAYAVTRQAMVTAKILYGQEFPGAGNTVVTITDNEVRDGDMLYKDFWDGKDAGGNFVKAGSYDVQIAARDIDAQLASMATVQMTIDVDPLRIFDVSIVPLTLENLAVVSYQISEPMKVVTKIFKPGTSLPSSTQDPPGGRLVKRIIGVRPARTQISEYWDGTDLTLSKVPDGNYVFKIYASTYTDAINTIDGVLSPTLCPGESCRVPDIVTSNIPVTRGGTSDLCGDFAGETFFAPNPYDGVKGWFKIPFIMNGWVSLKLYNIAGDLVYKRNYGDLNAPRDGGNNVDGGGKCAVTQTHEACWPKVNSYGATVAPGVYFAVIRFQATDGSRDICQTIKKILIP